MKSTLAASLLALGLFLPAAAAAQSETRTAVAEALYRQARDLMAAGNYEAACPKLAESQRLDPATGTLLNLAACHEKQGRFATAWLEYSDALVASRRDGREDRVDYARERAAELEPKVSKLTLLLAADADEPGLVLELDGANIGRAVMGAPTPVDPGQHTVRASAPGKKPWQQTIEIGATADQQSLTIPRLEAGPPEATPTTTATGATATTSPTVPPSDELSRPVPTSVYVTGGVTLALLAGAGITGLAYQNKNEDYEAIRRDPARQGEAQTRQDSVQRFGYVNLGLWIGAAAGASVTTYLFVTRPAGPTAARLSPWAAPGAAGLSLTGGF